MAEFLRPNWKCSRAAKVELYTRTMNGRRCTSADVGHRRTTTKFTDAVFIHRAQKIRWKPSDSSGFSPQNWIDQFHRFWCIMVMFPMFYGCLVEPGIRGGPFKEVPEVSSYQRNSAGSIGILSWFWWKLETAHVHCYWDWRSYTRGRKVENKLYNWEITALFGGVYQ